MSTLAPELPAGSGENLASDLAGMGNFLIDPAGAAKRVHSKWFWVGPLVLLSLVSLAASFVVLPMTRHVMEVAPLPPNTTPEQYQHGMEIGLTIQKVVTYLSPLVIAILFTVQAAILLAMSSVTGVRATFRQLFNLIAGCSVIQVVASLASLVILKIKGEISSMAELRPPLGLDIFLPEGANKVLAAALGYFSIFEIWWIVMLVLTFSLAFRTSKTKAAMIVAPLVVLSLLMRIGGAAFSR